MKRIIPIFLLLLLPVLMVAQNLTITGKVVSNDEPEGVIGANVTIKGTTVGTITDFDGNFTLTAKAGDVLLVSFMGYKPYETTIKNATPLRIVLVEDNALLDEVVVVGYGTMKKSDLTGAVSSVKADQLQKTPAAGLDQALQGRVAGVTVNANSGQPGQAATIRIRGIGSAMGGNEPLYVVDGVITSDISFLSPADIQSTEVLKDASATAIYGSRGANGVIIVTTKNGSKGKVNVSFDAYWGMQNRWKKLDLMTTEDFVNTKLRVDVMKNGAEQFAYYLKNGFTAWNNLYNLGNGKSPYFPINYDYEHSSTDWQDEVFNRNALIHNYNISVDGGNDQGHYALTASYFGQDGTIIGSNYERLTLRLNSDFKICKWLKVGEHLSFMASTGRNAMNNSASAGASVISAALAMAPWDPTHYPMGSVNGKGDDIGGKIAASSNFKNVTNPFTMLEMSEPKNNTERWVGDIYLEATPVDGLTLRASVSLDNSLVRNRNFKYAYEYSSYDKADKNFISSSMARYNTLLEEVTATYAKQIGKHNFSVMVGQTVEQYNYYSIGGSGASILNPIPTNWYLGNATDDKSPSSDGVDRVRRQSFLGRAFYNYADRYMITVNFRADGSSKFPENPWGFFPSAALAWRMSEEAFMADTRDWLDMLKIRAGWGQVGNDGVGSNNFALNMHEDNLTFTGYSFADELITGATVLTYVNKNGKWETNEQWDAGIDFSFFNGKLTGNIDYFLRDTKDALLYVTAPAHVGNRYSLTKNVGVIRNQGVEIALGHAHKVGKFSYNIDGNLSFIKNELVALNGGSPLYGDRVKTDYNLPLNAYWGYIYEGVYSSDQEALDQLHQYTAETIGVHAGDARYTDLNNDGKIDDDDKTYIGSSFPKLTYGLNFGCEFYGVDVQLFFQGVAGNQLYNALRLRTEGAGDECTLGTQMKDVWVGYSDALRASLEKNGVNWMVYENRQGTIPNPTGSSANFENSTRFLENGSYLRLKNIQIGYTLPQDITKKAYIQRARVYVSASNLFTITKYSGYDPECGSPVDYGNYPQSRTITFGLNLNF